MTYVVVFHLRYRTPDIYSVFTTYVITKLLTYIIDNLFVVIFCHVLSSFSYDFFNGLRGYRINRLKWPFQIKNTGWKLRL